MVELREFCNRILADYKNGKFLLVVSSIEAQAALSPIRLEVPLLLLAQSHYRLGHMQAAAHAYIECSRVAEEKAASYANIALRLLQKHGSKLEIAQAVERMFEIDPRDFEIAGIHQQNIRANMEVDKIAGFEKIALDAWYKGDPFYLSLEAPLWNIGWCTDEGINTRTDLMLDGVILPLPRPEERRAQPHKFAEKVRVGYVSDDFFDSHAITILFQGVPACHDRDRFEITLFCHTSEENIAKDRGFRDRNQFVRIDGMSDDEAAIFIRSRGIDILVDLKGYTRGSRSAIFNNGAAPIQVAWLGYPGPATGIDCDYIVGDRTVLPDSAKEHYREKFVRLPEVYQSNDSIFRDVPAAMSRQEANLPEGAFVFAAFNSGRKINEHSIDLWCRILQRVPGSILWLLLDNPVGRQNFLKAVQRCGVQPERIIFAHPYIYRFHISRVQAADLALDVFPYNGHTTTSDMLWAGLPVVTYRGGHFASRVSESLLRAAGMEELVSADAESFVELAVALAHDPRRIAALRKKIARNRFTEPLFDTERFTRHLEAAFEKMVEGAQNGKSPDHFDVPALPVRTAPFRDQAG